MLLEAKDRGHLHFSCEVLVDDALLEPWYHLPCVNHTCAHHVEHDFPTIHGEKGNAPEASFPEVDLWGSLAHTRAEISLCAPVQLHSSTETAPDLP